MSQEAGNSQHWYWVDLIRAVAIVLVIIIHVTSSLLYRWGKSPLAVWMTGNIYDSLARIAVPLFFMVSGALLLGKQEPLQDFFRKRASKLLIPFMFWTLFYLAWRCNVTAVDSCSRKNIMRFLLVDGTYYHLWFLYALMGLYLITPLVRVVATSTEKNILWYFIILWLIFQPGLAILDTFWKINIGVSLPAATGYIGYFVLGYLLNEVNLSKHSLLATLIIWLLSTAATIIGTYVMSARVGEYFPFFYDYLNLSVILASVSAFILLKSLINPNVSDINSHAVKLLNQISVASFGIYLVHAFVLDVIGGHIPLIHFNVEMGNPIWSIPLVSGMTFVISFLAVIILQKIPVINHIVP